MIIWIEEVMVDNEGLIDVTEDIRDDVSILHIEGRLDAISSPLAEHKIFDYINQGKHKLLLDFSKVDYLSSAGMRMLLSTTKKLKALDGKLVVCSVTPNVIDVLRMSGFDHVLDLARTEEDGLRRF
jgi:anti-sigma B factor antagonist/stage II sporulation protein AA (anti-sigma F factor antagonist)